MLAIPLASRLAISEKHGYLMNSIPPSLLVNNFIGNLELAWKRCYPPIPLLGYPALLGSLLPTP
jgi:hypothetical protein